MKRSTLILLFVLTFIGIGLNVSSAIATDDPRGEAHERKRFRADLQTTSRLVEPTPGRCSDQHRAFASRGAASSGWSR